MLYRRAGYRVELVVLAVRAADSRQGTAERCARMSRASLPPRFTTAQGDDRHFEVLADTVAAAEKAHVADSIMVWGRDGSVLYRSDRKGLVTIAAAAAGSIEDAPGVPDGLLASDQEAWQRIVGHGGELSSRWCIA